MSVIIFIVILAVLVFVHELGHFIAAKLSGMRVDEFGLGFPPRLFGVKRGETIYSINAIPFGGFVKIFGEDPNEESLEGQDSGRSFTSKSKWKQVIVLIAGISCNIIFAWLVISAGFMIGQPASVDSYPGVSVEHPQVTVTDLEPGSPAAASGIMAGDVITGLGASDGALASGSSFSVTDVQHFIAGHGNEIVTVSILRGKDPKSFVIVPKTGIMGDTAIIGVGLDMVGIIHLPVYKAIYEGAILAYNLLKTIVVGLAVFIYSIFHGSASLSDVSGPVGIAGLVGNARELGLVYLLSFTAYISLNLAVINLIPFPALDGGRILFVIIEKIKGSPIRPKVANVINGIGFLLLIILMLVVTFHDILKLIR